MRTALIAILTLAAVSACGRDAPKTQLSSFAAVGKPGWALSIDPGDHMSIVYDGAQSSATLPAPKPTIRGNQTLYVAKTDKDALTVRIEELACTDSGKAYPARVTVNLNGREMVGCGGPTDGQLA